MKVRWAVCLILLGGVSCSAGGAGQTDKGPVRVGVPGKEWLLEFQGTNFKVERNGVQPDGRVYVLANDEVAHLTLSVFLEKISGSATKQGCMDNQKARLGQELGYKRTEVSTREEAGMTILEFTIPEFKGAPVRQRNLFACLPKDDVYVDIHLSKVSFKPEEEQLLEAVLKSAQIVNQANSGQAPLQPESSRDLSGLRTPLVAEGSRYYMQRNYAAAIPPYQKALDEEKRSPSLDATFLRVLIDNLGTAYGITGDLQRSEETLRYGVSRDPTYPMFYYNLACVAAERNDEGKTMELLKKAFSYKDNVIQGEHMPDPKTDDSFEKFQKDKQFQELLRSL